MNKLRGSYPAKIDEKNRLKIPAKFRRDLEDEENSYFVTSQNGKCAQIYPMAVWDRITEKLQSLPRGLMARDIFDRITNYYGIPTQMDPQGRMLIPQTLREDAQISGEVTVIGRDDHLEVWNHENIRNEIKGSPLTSEHFGQLESHGF
jgi:MraZ protein